MPDCSKKSNPYQQFAKEFSDRESALRIFKEALLGDGNINTSEWRDLTEVIVAEPYALSSKPANNIPS